MTSLEELGDLPALRSLDLRSYKRLLRLPGSRKSRNLQTLLLDGCPALELHEDDVATLSELPLLSLVSFSDKIGDENLRKFRLDLARRKVLVYSCEEKFCFVQASALRLNLRDWVERYLGLPPISIGHRGH